MDKNKRQIIPNRYSLLCLDAGSTLIKAAQYANGEIRFICSEKSIGSLLGEINKYTSHNFNEILITGHQQWQEELQKVDWPADKCTLLDTSYIPETHFNYDTPETLGLDRYLVCLGALNSLKRGETDNGVFVVDAGTACTIDFMSKAGVFNGGVIMPGLRIWENGIRQFTPQLPAVERELPSTYPGKTTQSCLQWGLLGSFAAAIQYHTERLERIFGSGTVMITGGDAADVLKPLQIPESNYDKLMVFRGMVEFRKWLVNEPFQFE